MYIIIFELILFFVSFYFTSLSFFPNNSLFGILIASQFAFVAPFINSLIENHKTADLNKTILKLVTIAFCAFVLIATAGRAGLAGFAIALLIMNLKRFWKLPRLKKIIIIISSILFLCLLLFAKPDSSKGRLLIYKVVLNEMPASQMISGIGFGEFKNQYNHFQSVYFSNHSIDSSEALLADNTYFAFNDPFQLIIELGIFGFIIFFIFFIFLLKRFISDFKIDFFGNDYLKGAYMTVFCFLIGSLFSYPFHILSFLPLFILSIVIIFK